MAAYDFSAPRLFVEGNLREGAVLTLDKTQQNYLANVLRLKQGDGVLVFNGSDGEWRAVLEPLAGDTRRQRERLDALRVDSRMREQTAAGDLHYLFAPLKHARLDYMVQKAVEMGVSALRPVITRRTNVARVNGERLRANAIEAAEQCGILSVPEIRPEQRFDDVFASWESGRVLVFCDEEASVGDSLAQLRAVAPGQPLAVLIGPEGGFDPAERDRLLALPDIVRLSLGPRILRADTAAVAALALVQATIGDAGRTDCG